MSVSATQAAAPPRWPRQLPYIIASEACERFSFYGMRNILTPFLMTRLVALYSGATACWRCQRCVPLFCHRGVFFPVIRWLPGRPLVWQVTTLFYG